MIDWMTVLSKDNTWAYLMITPESVLDDLVLTIPEGIDLSVRIVRGKRCLTKQGLFQEFAAALQFPYYFGENWDAFSECLSDLEWLHAQQHVIMISNLSRIQDYLGRDYEILLEILKDVVQEWDDKTPTDSTATTFRVILHNESDDPTFINPLLNLGVTRLISTGTP